MNTSSFEESRPRAIRAAQGLEPFDTLLVNGKVVITYTGTLQSSATVNGTYSAVAGATSPYTPPSTGAHVFYRAQQ